MHHIIPSYSIYCMSRIKRRRWWVLHFTDVSHLVSEDWLRCQTHESMNRSTVTLNFRGCGSSSGAWQQGGEDIETCCGRRGRCKYCKHDQTMEMLQEEAKEKREEKARMDWASVDGWTQIPWIELLKTHIPLLCHCMILISCMWVCYCCDCHSLLNWLFEAIRIIRIVCSGTCK